MLISVKISAVGISLGTVLGVSVSLGRILALLIQSNCKLGTFTFALFSMMFQFLEDKSFVSLEFSEIFSLDPMMS